jgi:hypothetical protein
MNEDLKQLEEALKARPAEEREGLLSQLIELVKQAGKGIAKLKADISLPTVSHENFESAYQLIVGVMGWELELATNQVSPDRQRQALELIDRARKSFPFHQKIELENFRKTKSNYPLTGSELVQWMLFNNLEALEKKNEKELTNIHQRPHEQALVLRYLKFLLFNVGYKKPFRLVGGITGFLYNYNTNEFAKVYECLMQSKDGEFKKKRYDKNLRQHIRDHLTHVLNRFGPFLALGEAEPHWKDFKEVRSENSSISSYVEQSLKLLLPWDSVNRLPDSFSRQNTSIPFFAARKNDWFARSVAGRDRRRLLVDQNLLDQIANALDCPPIYGNYFIPRFKKMNKPNTFPSQLDQLPKPNGNLFTEFDRLGEQHLKRLKQLDPQKLFVRVADEQHGDIYEINKEEQLHLSITVANKVIEFFAHCDGEEVGLGAIVPDAFGAFDYPEAQRAKVLWQLPNGRKIITKLRPAPDALVDESGVASRIDLFINYKKEAFFNFTPWSGSSPLSNLRSLLSARSFPAPRWLSFPLIAVIAIVLIVVHFRKNSNSRKAYTPPSQIEIVPSNSNAGALPTPDVAVTNRNSAPAPPKFPRAPSNKVPGAGDMAQKPQRVNPASDDELIKRDFIPLEKQEEALAMLNAPKNLQLNKSISIPAPLGSEDTRGVENANSNFSASPNGTYVKSYQPVLHWTPPANAKTYVVSLWNSKDRLIAQGQTSESGWMVNKQLVPDEFYRWEIEAKDASGQSLPFVIKGAFSTLGVQQNQAVGRDEKRYSRSHLLLGLTYFKAGLLDDAEQELRLLVSENPKSKKARSLLRRVQALRANKR